MNLVFVIPLPNKKSLISGYNELGKGYLWVYAIITLASTFTILAALYSVTAGLLLNLLGITFLSINLTALILFLTISIILIVGKYYFLEQSLKLVITLLFIALLATTVMVLTKGAVPLKEDFIPPDLFAESSILFIIGLVGWMPTAVEASGWVSVWSAEKLRSEKTKTSFVTAKKEFDFGYLITAILALFFMVIGLTTLYGSNTSLSGNSVIFAEQIVSIFTSHIGDWSFLIIAFAAFATMFSTCMTAHDAIARVSLDILKNLAPKQPLFSHKSSFAVTILLMTGINWLVIILFKGHMGNLVGLATFVSFVFAPLVGFMNHKVVTNQNFSNEV